MHIQISIMIFFIRIRLLCKVKTVVCWTSGRSVKTFHLNNLTWENFRFSWDCAIHVFPKHATSQIWKQQNFYWILLLFIISGTNYLGIQVTITHNNNIVSYRRNINMNSKGNWSIGNELTLISWEIKYLIIMAEYL